MNVLALVFQNLVFRPEQKKIVECKGACQISNSETSFFNVNEFFSEFFSIDF